MNDINIDTIKNIHEDQNLNKNDFTTLVKNL
jgi:hypothetical protein